MTLVLSTNDATTTNSINLTGTPAVRITGSRIRFVNTEAGRVNATDGSAPAITLDGFDNIIENQFGGIIGVPNFANGQIVIQGSSGADTILNSGLIRGVISLGGGNDIYTETATATGGIHVASTIDLGAGDDRATLFTVQATEGGTGTDTVHISSVFSQNYNAAYPGSRITGFEILEISNVVDANGFGRYTANLENFTGFQQIRILPATFANFINSPNPDAAVTIDGGAIILQGTSTVASIAGGSGRDGVELSGTGSVSGNIDLGDGDDGLSVRFATGTSPSFSGSVNGGAGIDRLQIDTFEQGAVGNFDLSRISGFEILVTYYLSGTEDRTTISNASGFEYIVGDGNGATLTIDNSNLANANGFTFGQSTFVIGSGTTLGSYGAVILPTFPGRNIAALEAVQQGNDLENRRIENNGTIIGNILLDVGDDVYDGRNGTVGGMVRSFAGNDHLMGGAATDWLDGGFGIDRLEGGGGDDILIGGGGNDALLGGAGADQLFGGAGNDSYDVVDASDLLFENSNEGIDTVNTGASHYLYANIENLTLTGTANAFGVGNELGNALIGNNGENLLIAGAGDDFISGGSARDAIFGEGGDDILNGDAGIDYIVAGIGNDSIDGGADADEIYGQDGNDIIYGGTTFDTDIIVGGLGNDTIYGNSGLGDYDLLYGNEGDDVFHVDTPDDLVFEQAGQGVDTVYAGIGGAGYYLYGNIENLILLGETPFGVGNDLANRLTGNAIGNYLLGGAGNDTLNGMGGNDVLFGESGNDVFAFTGGTGGDVIGDFVRGQDRIDVSAYGFTFAQLQANFSQNGNDGAINLGNGDFIVLNGVTMSQLTASDFILAPVSEVLSKADPAVLNLSAVFDFSGTDAASSANLASANAAGLCHLGRLQQDLFV